MFHRIIFLLLIAVKGTDHKYRCISFDVNSKTRIVADASPVGLGAVLIHLQGVERRVIA